MRLYPTEKTEVLLPQIQAVLRDWGRRLTEDLTPEECETLIRLLGRMKEKAVEWMEAR